MPNYSRLLSDGTQQNKLYALVNGSSSFYEINLGTNSLTTRASSPTSYYLGNNYEAYLLNTAPDDFIVFATYYNDNKYWYAYNYKANRWTKLTNFETPSNSSGHFFFDPMTLHAFYHVNGRGNWEKIDMRPALDDAYKH